MSDFETAKQFFLQGLQALEANDLSTAEGMFARSLEIIPDRVSTLNNLAAIEIKLGKFSEAEAFARRAIVVEENSPEAWSNFGLALTALDRHEDALKACNRALSCNPSHAMALLAKVVTLRALKKYDEALVACDQALKLDPTKYELLYNRSVILKELNRPNEAQEVYQQAFNMRVASSPVFSAERCATQKAEVLIVNRRPAGDHSFTPIDDFGRWSPNFPGQLDGHLHGDFHFNYIFSADAIRPSNRARISKPDLIINNHVDAELLLSDSNLSPLTQFIDSFGVPVVNHPSQAVQTGRDTAEKVLGDIPGVIIPKTKRFSSVGKTPQALAREIESYYAYPVIARTLVGHEGAGMSKIDSRDALIELLSSGCPEYFFITQFVDSRGQSPHYRKIRAAIVADQIILIRVDFSDHWNVHGRKKAERWAFYKANLHLLDEEKRICLDPEAGLGKVAMQAVREIRRRTPLEVFGMDFDVDPDGQLIFYEANAAMNLFSVAPKEISNPKEAGDRLKQAFQEFFTSLTQQRSCP